MIDLRSFSFFFFATPQVMGTSLTRELDTKPPVVEVWNLNHWIAREINYVSS